MTGNQIHGNVTISDQQDRLRRPLPELVRIFAAGDIPAVGELNPYLLGATSSAFGGPSDHGHRDRYVARTANRVDARLAAALTGARMVIVVGPSKAGKTRTLFEAIHAFDPGARIVWPVLDGLGELAAHPRIADTSDTIVMWLDDVHEYLTGTQQLTPAVLARLTTRPGRTLVVATLRSEMRAQLRSEGELQRDTRLLLEQALIIDLASTSEDPDEQAAAIHAYPGQVFGAHGLGEVLAGAPELLARYDDAKAADLLQRTVIRITIDWARIGRPDPLPEPVLTDLTIREMRVRTPEIDLTEEAVRAAIITARTPPHGAGRAAALLTHYLDDETRGYRPFDYLVAAEDGQDHRTPRPIQDGFWYQATHDATPEILFAVANTAYERDYTATAITLFQQAAAAGHLGAMSNLGVLLAEQGRDEAAEVWLRKAADAGHLGAVFNLGVLLAERGEGQAEVWLRKAADAGHLGAMTNLGVLLDKRGEGQAEVWLRKAADAAEPNAMFNLGVLLDKRGEGQAEVWLRKAADAGHLGAMTNLGILLAEQGREDEAEVWLRKAADAGHLGAMTNLGILLSEQGREDEAEVWLRKAADAADPNAMFSLGVSLDERGEGEAEVWLRKAADAGHLDAMTNLGVLLAERGEGEAEVWLRKAADAGHLDAMTNLGILLSERREEKAEVQRREAAEQTDE
ncbi:tetratricopeptide repeat protein [Nocardia gipuzkoensis]